METPHILPVKRYQVTGKLSTWDVSPDPFEDMMKALQTNYISQIIGVVIRFVIYIIASINFLRSGSWVKKLMGQKLTAE